MTSEIDMNVFNNLRDSTGMDFIGELIDTFLEDAPKLIRQMREAVERGDAESLRLAAHSMKSNCATFGAMHASDLVRELEGLGREKSLSVGNRLEILEQIFGQVKLELEALK